MKRSKIYVWIFIPICVVAVLLAGYAWIGKGDNITMEEIYAQGNHQCGGYSCFDESRLYCCAWDDRENRWIGDRNRKFCITQLNGLSVESCKPCFNCSSVRWNLTPYEGNIYYSKMNWNDEEYGIYRMSQSGNDNEKILDAYEPFQIVDSFIYYVDWTERDNFFDADDIMPTEDSDCHLYRYEMDGSNKEEIIAEPIYDFYVLDDFILCENDKETERICLYTLNGKKKKTLTDRHAYRPVYNGEKGSGMKTFEDTKVVDSQGEAHFSGLCGYCDIGDFDDNYFLWKLNREYSKLTATGIVSASDLASKNVASYKIYGDDVLLYNKEGLTADTKPYEISVDISGVDILKIEMYGQGNLYSNGIDSYLCDVFLIQ